ncbi:hypothetical protein A3Q56_00526 [Intoshia linei]|uniref:Uncharacterized protein n=1 Tax=Intoshia linei TaxID=1819745 RepID=A0A177BBW4_9BILA|nr:hypothetical protein A3Q56_00526 [Intoshia linei]
MCNSNLKPCLLKQIEKLPNDEKRFIENFRIKRARYDQKSKSRYRWGDKLSHDMRVGLFQTKPDMINLFTINNNKTIIKYSLYLYLLIIFDRVIFLNLNKIRFLS